MGLILAYFDDVLGTLTVIKSFDSNKVFGGYTQADWSLLGYKYDSNIVWLMHIILLLNYMQHIIHNGMLFIQRTQLMDLG
jgi:hypothetical protein